MTLEVRRIVTGHDAEGKAIVASDERISAAASPTRPGISRVEIWSTDKMPVDNSEGAAAEAQRNGFVVRHNYVGSGQGTVVRITEFAPGRPNSCTAPKRSTTRSCSRANAISNSTTARPWTMKPGDIVVQRGTMHAWVNTGTRAVRLRLCPDRRRSGRGRRPKADDALPVAIGTSTAAEPRARGAMGRLGSAARDLYGRAFLDEVGERQRVPVRQVDAAVREVCRLLRVGHAVDSVSVAGRQFDRLDETGRIVRAGRDRHLPAALTHSYFGLTV